MQIEVHHRDTIPNVQWTKAFKPELLEQANETETSEDLRSWYQTLIVFVWVGAVIGASLATMAMFSIYWDAIERAKLMYDTDDMIKQVQYNTDQIRWKIQQNAEILPKINENIEKLGTGIVQDLKPKEAKIINQK